MGKEAAFWSGGGSCRAFIILDATFTFRSLLSDFPQSWSRNFRCPGALTVSFTPPPNSAPTGLKGGLLSVPTAPLFFGSGRGCHCSQAFPQKLCSFRIDWDQCAEAASVCQVLLLHLRPLLTSSSRQSLDEPLPWIIVVTFFILSGGKNPVPGAC